MDALRLCLLQRLLDGGVDDLFVHGVFFGDRIGDQHTALVVQLTLGAEHGGQLRRGIHAVVHAETGLTGIEGGQLLRAVADHGHALGLEIFQREAEIEDGLRARADDHDRRLGQFLQIGGDVHGDLRAPVYAADAAGGENLDARHVGDDHGGGDSGCAVGLSRDQRGQITAAGFGDASSGFAEVFDLLAAQTCLESAADDGDGGGRRAVRANRLLDQQRCFYVLWIGHAMGDDGAFQRDDGLARLQRGLYFGGNIKMLIHSILL